MRVPTVYRLLGSAENLLQHGVHIPRIPEVGVSNYYFENGFMNLYENLSTAMFCDLIDKNYLK